jgi:hypothetical protein
LQLKIHKSWVRHLHDGVQLLAQLGVLGRALDMLGALALDCLLQGQDLTAEENKGK